MTYYNLYKNTIYEIFPNLTPGEVTTFLCVKVKLCDTQRSFSKYLQPTII